jgi:alpha-mannosidase
MKDKFNQVLVTRIERFKDRIAKDILEDSIKFDAEYSWSKDPVPFDNRLKLEYESISEGDQWGKTWESGWFRLNAIVPKEWAGKCVVANLDFSGEGLVFSKKGEILQGITNGSVFQNDFSRDVVRLFEDAKGGEKVELWVETAANGLFGMFLDLDPEVDAKNRFGHYEAKAEKMRLAIFDVEMWHLHLDLRIVIGLLKRLDEKSVRVARIIHIANRALDIYRDRNDVIECRSILKEILDQPAAPSDLSVLAVGHAHIDTAWLWPVRESIRKCARTFSNQLDLIDRYPDYVFGASQPQHYAFVKEYYPELYERIKVAVKAGRWELQGGMWVEADCNLISGESMVRQILHGKNFFMDEFGIGVDNLWLPDVFGYSAAMPQILRKSGIKSFLTQKISWNQFNEFPHHTFNWRGIDGSEVLTHFPPENNYNSQLDAEYLVPAQTHFKERGFVDEFISLFGVGDGGGGPKEENIETGLRLQNCEGAPKVRFGTAKEFFDGLEKYKEQLPKWVGELYLELHRGTLTTQAKVKKGNRKLELKLREVEYLYSQLPLENYPSKELDAIWKKVLINQFHDIIPGSSIHIAYEVTHKEHEDALKACDELIKAATEKLFESDENSIVVANYLHFQTSDIVELPESWIGFEINDEDGKPVPTQDLDGKAVALAEVKAYSFKTITRGQVKKKNSIEPNELVLENDLIKYSFNKNGELISIWDHETSKEILEEGKQGNSLTLYDDHPNDWDAWDVDLFYENHIIDTAQVSDYKLDGKGDVCSGLTFNGKIGQSKYLQKIILRNDSKRLDFETKIDWSEKHKMLRVAFPVNVYTEQASFDIQYGHVKRNTHRNTSWDKAKFEVVGHKYADLSDRDYGVALLNDCKYGYKVYDNILDLNLLRSPNYPDADADQGTHRFTYSLLPHIGDLINSTVIAESSSLNQPLALFESVKTGNHSSIRLEGDGVSLEVIKKAEKEECLILRVVETHGRGSSGILYLDDQFSRLCETNLIEWIDQQEIKLDKSIEISLTPFEIKTYKLWSGDV